MPSLVNEIKPSRWNVSVGLIDPKWQVFYGMGFAGLVPFWETDGSPFDLVSKNKGTLSGTTSWVTTNRGAALHFNGGQKDRKSVV